MEFTHANVDILVSFETRNYKKRLPPGGIFGKITSAGSICLHEKQSGVGNAVWTCMTYFHSKIRCVGRQRRMVGVFLLKEVRFQNDLISFNFADPKLVKTVEKIRCEKLH